MRYSCMGAVLVAALVLSGCAENKTRVGEGAGVGGVLGAGVGAIMGYQSGHPYQGALIGGAVGTAGGAAVGSQIKKPVAQDTAPLTMARVVELTKQGVSSDDIITRIKATNSKYSLTAEDVTYLNKQGVSQRVIEAMQGS